MYGVGGDAGDWGTALQGGKVLGSIPGGVVDFILPALDSTQFLTEISTRVISWGGGMCLGLTNLSPSSADCLEIQGASTSGSSKGLFRPVQG
jgi:hypothetical protein